MDARLDPARALGLEKGDAHVIGNAGGVVTEAAIRSLTHLPAAPGNDVDHPRPRRRRQSIARIKASPFLATTDDVRSFLYEVETGRLQEVS